MIIATTNTKSSIASISFHFECALSRCNNPLHTWSWSSMTSGMMFNNLTTRIDSHCHECFPHFSSSHRFLFIVQIITPNNSFLHMKHVKGTGDENNFLPAIFSNLLTGDSWEHLGHTLSFHNTNTLKLTMLTVIMRQSTVDVKRSLWLIFPKCLILMIPFMFVVISQFYYDFILIVTGHHSRISAIHLWIVKLFVRPVAELLISNLRSHRQSRNRVRKRSSLG